jgi:hypothetical protein
MALSSEKTSKLLAVYCTAFFCLSSCNEKIKSFENEIAFDTIRIDKTFQSKTGKPELTYKMDLAFVYPKSFKNNEKLKVIQSAFVDKFFPYSSNYTHLSPKIAVDSFLVQYNDYFQSLCLSKFNDEIETAEEHHHANHSDSLEEEKNNYPFYFNIENKIVFNRNNLISFTVESDMFEGGAHGSHGIFGYVLNLNTGEFISEDAFAGINYKKNLSSVIVSKILKANNLVNEKELLDIGYDDIGEIAPNGNFTVDEKGITYYFNEYEIAAYYVGSTKVFIPYEELKIFITDDNPIAILSKK